MCLAQFSDPEINWPREISFEALLPCCGGCSHWACLLGMIPAPRELLACEHLGTVWGVLTDPKQLMPLQGGWLSAQVCVPVLLSWEYWHNLSILHWWRFQNLPGSLYYPLSTLITKKSSLVPALDTVKLERVTYSNLDDNGRFQFLSQSSLSKLNNPSLLFPPAYLQVQNPSLDAVLQVTLYQHSAWQRKYIFCLKAHPISVTPKWKLSSFCSARLLCSYQFCDPYKAGSFTNTQLSCWLLSPLICSVIACQE